MAGRTPPGWVPAGGGIRLALSLGFAGTAVSTIGSWVPSFWGDEAATVMSASRPLSSLLPMLLNVDAVHGSYYLVMHFWIGLFGASEFSVRFPSALAAGITVAGLTLLAGRLCGSRVALFAGIACVVLPCLTNMGAEARQYALSAACAVWLTLLLVRLLDDTMPPLRRGWTLYAIGVAIGVYLFLYLALMLIVHAIILVSVTHSRRMLRAFALAALGGLALALPVIVLALIQRNQVSFLATPRQTRIDRLVIEQWFGYPVFAALAWLLIVAVAGSGLTFDRVRRWFRGTGHPPDPLLIALCWLLLPCALLLLAHAVIPLYSLRYLTFAAPAAALLIGMAIALPPRRVASGVLVVALLATSLPSWLGQRGPHAKNNSDWRQVAQTIGAAARPGDGVLFQDDIRPSIKARLAWHLYPEHFDGVHDLLLEETLRDHRLALGRNTPACWVASPPDRDRSGVGGERWRRAVGPRRTRATRVRGGADDSPAPHHDPPDGQDRGCRGFRLGGRLQLRDGVLRGHPGEHGALHAGDVAGHPAEHGGVAEQLLVGFDGAARAHRGAEHVDPLPQLRNAEAVSHLDEQRSRRLRDRAAVPFPVHGRHHVGTRRDVQLQRDLVATGRVDLVRLGSRPGLEAEAVRMPGVVEDQLLVERLQFGRRHSDTPKKLTASATPATSWSTSSSVVYRYALARVDAVTPSLRCRGCAQW